MTVNFSKIYRKKLSQIFQIDHIAKERENFQTYCTTHNTKMESLEKLNKPVSVSVKMRNRTVRLTFLKDHLHMSIKNKLEAKKREKQMKLL